jgi:hypothetical protein
VSAAIKYLREGRNVVVDDCNATESVRVSYTMKARQLETELNGEKDSSPSSTTTIFTSSSSPSSSSSSSSSTLATRTIRRRLVVFLPAGGLTQCLWQAEWQRAALCAQIPLERRSHCLVQVAPEDEWIPWIPWLTESYRPPVPFAAEGFDELLHRRTKLVVPYTPPAHITTPHSFFTNTVQFVSSLPHSSFCCFLRFVVWIFIFSILIQS